MPIELPLAILCLVLTFVILVSTILEKTEQDIPLEELAMLLLFEYRELQKLPVEKRLAAKEIWDSKFRLYCDRMTNEPAPKGGIAIRLVK